MWRRASAAERTRFFTASRDRLTHLEFDALTQLTPEDRGHILAQLAQLAIAKPESRAARSTPPQTAGSQYPLAPNSQRNPQTNFPPNYAPQSQPTGPRRLTVLELARARRAIHELVPGNTHTEILRQVIWSIEEGALRRFPPQLALNIALKKIRESAWSKPNRLPPNWMPRSLPLRHAVPEHCTAA